MLKEFKEFIAKGNVVDLAVAVVIGAAFTAIVTSFTTNVLNPILAAIVGKPNFDDALILTINNAQIRFGALITTIINFVIIAFALFLVVKAMNRLQNLRSKEEEEAVEDTELDLLTQIRDELVAANGGAPRGDA